MYYYESVDVDLDILIMDIYITKCTITNVAFK